MISNTGPKVIGLHLIIKQFQLSKEIFKRGDDIRVSITTIPEQKKEATVIPSRQMGYANIDFCVNITIPDPELAKDFVCDCTEKIIVVFRRKSFFLGDPIIASTIISAKDFPKQIVNGEKVAKQISIYEPIGGPEGTHSRHHHGRRSVGQMIVEIKYIDPVPEQAEDDGDFLIDYLPNPTIGTYKEIHQTNNDENYSYNHLEQYQRM